MTILEMSQFCCETVGDISSEMVDYAKRSIRLKYQTLYDAHAWRESMRTYDILLDPKLKGSLFLPYDAEEVIFLKLSRDGVNFMRLNYRERDWIERVWATTLYSLPGNWPLYYRGENLAWPYINPGIFTFTTSYPTPFTVYIEGKDFNNNPINESFYLQATKQTDGTIIPGSVSTANNYQIVTTLSKDGYGDLKVQDAATGVPLTLSSGTSNFVFTQLVLFPPLVWTNQDGSPIPYAVQTQVKLKPDTLDNDMSVPRISHIWDALIEFTLSALYTKARQLTKADSREQKAIQHVQAAVNIEKNQSESRQQVIPTMYEEGDYLGERYRYVTSATPFG
jgi:hypothetical protein